MEPIATIPAYAPTFPTSTTHYRAIVAYDGTCYKGFQRLSEGEPTIQALVEAAISSANGGGLVTVTGAGRTDAGVHATGQVIAFDLTWKHDDETLLRAVNALLPTDIALQRIERAAPGFHPRFDAVSRMYQYFVYEAQIRQPMMARMAWWVRPPIHTRLDIDAMNWAATKLIGIHDFGSFGTPTGNEPTMREVFASEWMIERPRKAPGCSRIASKPTHFCIIWCFPSLQHWSKWSSIASRLSTL